MPEMVSVSIAGTPPLSQFRPTVELTAQSASASLQPSSVVSRGVGPDYFGTIELPLIRGRGFSRDPSDDQTALIVNEALARRLWPDQDPMGRSVRVEGETSERRVIGVASNAAHRDLWDMAEPYVYLPVLRRTVRSLTLLARVRTTPAAAAARLRDEMTAHSSQLVVLDARTADDDLRAHLSRQRLAATVAVVLAVMAATLVAVGIFGLFSYVVTQSRRDFGIRLALGAEYRQVQRQVVPSSASPGGGRTGGGARRVAGRARGHRERDLWHRKQRPHHHGPCVRGTGARDSGGRLSSGAPCGEYGSGSDPASRVGSRHAPKRSTASCGRVTPGCSASQYQPGRARVLRNACRARSATAAMRPSPVDLALSDRAT